MSWLLHGTLASYNKFWVSASHWQKFSMFTPANNGEQTWLCISHTVLWISLMKAILGLCTCPATLWFSLINVIELLKIFIVVVLFFLLKIKLNQRKEKQRITNPAKNEIQRETLKISQCNFPLALIRVIKTVQHQSYKEKHQYTSVIIIILAPSETIMRKIVLS